jgi:hypothetical protein
VRSTLANFAAALLVFFAIVWFFLAKEKQDVASLAERHGVAPSAGEARPAAPSPAASGAAPAVSSSPTVQSAP